MPPRKGRRSFAALLPDNAYGTVVEAALQRAVANARGRVMSVERYALDKSVDAGPRRRRSPALVKSGTVDAVFMPDGGAGGAVPRPDPGRRRASIPDKITYLGSGQWDDPAIARESTLNGALLPGARQHRLRRLRPALPGAFGVDAEPHGDARLRRRRASRPG